MGSGRRRGVLDMVNEMIRREAGRHARPRTLRGGSCAAPAFRTPSLGRCRARPAPAEEQDKFKERVKRTILGVSRARVRGAGSRRGRRRARGHRQDTGGAKPKSRDEVRTGFSTKTVQAVRGAWTRQDPRKGRGAHEL